MLRPSYKKRTWITLAVATLLYSLFSYATSDIEIANNSFRPAIALLSAFAGVYGPVYGFIAGFLGNIGVDWLNNQFWWNWSLGNGIIGLLCGLMVYVPEYPPKDGKLTAMQWVMFLIFIMVGNYVGLTFAAVLDVLLDRIPFPQAVFGSAITPATINFLSSLVLAPPLLMILLNWRMKED
ncbi:ECF transporter S component [Brevibacillus fluminis]|nr:ECF transporter S component [Brevibacillus fluminis]